MEGFETPFGLELLATAHWVSSRERAVNTQEAVAKIYAWNECKKRFSKDRIALALDTLGYKGWLTTG